METILKRIENKKKQLDCHRPLNPALVNNLNQWFNIELTYSSNALEGNTLTRSETALVVEKGLTVNGKSLVDHLEAVNLAFALDYVKELAHMPRNQITLSLILQIHALIFRSIDSMHAGTLRTIQVKISGSDLVLPIPLKVPELMDEFINWLQTAQGNEVTIAADAHLKLITIHPFVDGNGRTARLLMNLILMQSGYPPAIIPQEKRAEYIDVLEQAQPYLKSQAYYTFIYQCVENSLDIYLNAIAQSL